jgi:hypothetical protein
MKSSQAVDFSPSGLILVFPGIYVIFAEYEDKIFHEMSHKIITVSISLFNITENRYGKT